jgi:hypothetical protein
MSLAVAASFPSDVIYRAPPFSRHEALGRSEKTLMHS